MEPAQIKKLIREYIAKHVFSGTLPSDFTDDTPLVSTRLINSIVVLHLINHFEELFKIEFEAHEISVDNLDTVNMISEFFHSKINA